MKPLLRLSSFLLLAAGLALTGCYEGMGGSGNGKGSAPGKPTPGQKPFGLVTVDVFRPSDQALSDATCGGIQTSIIPFRQAEMNARTKGLTDYLSSQADVMRVIPNEIDLQNCQSYQFSEVEQRASNTLPDPQVDDSVKAKLTLHIRLILWYGTGGNFVSQNVLANDWADIQRLQQIGFTRTLSVNEFAITGPQTGYMWNWKNQSDPNNQFVADVVLNPLPTDDGLNQILTAAKQSGVNFSQWLTQRTQGL